MSNYKTVFFTLGILQIILGIFMFFPIIAQFFYGEVDSSFFGASIITIIFGTLFLLSNLDHDRKLNLQQAFLLTALSWLSIAIFSSLPFILSINNFSFTNAFFESMSGITTTGSTIIPNLNEMLKSILLWRAILQWLGGIGIIVMAITLMPIMNVGGMQLFKISSNDTAEKILPKSKQISIRLIIIYSTLITASITTMWGLSEAFWDNGLFMLSMWSLRTLAWAIVMINAYSLMMKITWSEVGGTQFTGYMAMMNLSAIIGYQLTDPLGSRFDYSTLFLIAAVFETLVI